MGHNDGDQDGVDHLGEDRFDGQTGLPVRGGVVPLVVGQEVYHLCVILFLRLRTTFTIAITTEIIIEM